MNELLFKATHPFIRLYWWALRPKTYGSRALILYNNKILLARNINTNYWSLPGGKIALPESPEECILRELIEELNLSDLEIGYKLGEYISKNEGKRDTVHIFVIRLNSLRFQKQWELEDAQWFELDNLPKNISLATSRRITEYLSGGKDLIGDW